MQKLEYHGDDLKFDFKLALKSLVYHFECENRR